MGRCERMWPASSRRFWSFHAGSMLRNTPGDAKRLIPWWLMRQPEHTTYPVNDAGVTLTDMG